MTIWHRNRRGRGCTTPRCRSQNIANNTFSEGWLQKSNEFAGLRTAPATHHAKNTANKTFSCGMLQNAGFGTIPCGGGGGSEPRTGIIYTYMYVIYAFMYVIHTINSVKNWSFCTFRHQIEGRKFSRLFRGFQKQSQSKHVWVHHSFKKNKTHPNHKSNSNICTWPQKPPDNFQLPKKEKKFEV